MNNATHFHPKPHKSVSLNKYQPSTPLYKDRVQPNMPTFYLHALIYGTKKL